jgi:hypothetical protein
VVGTVRPITFSHHSQEFFFSDDLPWMSLGPVQVLHAQLPTRGIPRLSRSRARPLLALWVQGSRGTASERITTVSLDSIRSQLFFNGTGLWALGGPDDLQRTPDTELGSRPRESWDEGTAKLECGGAYVRERLKPPMGQEGLFLTNGVQSRGQNRSRESRPSGIVGGLAESWTRVELGTRCTTERVQVGNSPPTVARAAFLSRQPQAGF